MDGCNCLTNIHIDMLVRMPILLILSMNGKPNIVECGWGLALWSAASYDKGSPRRRCMEGVNKKGTKPIGWRVYLLCNNIRVVLLSSLKGN